tara:strand:- start:85 stop:345 length:261 start_codon:yes stop_codon:yes gene_type:complete
MNNSIEQEAKKLSQRVLLVLGTRLNGFYRQRFVALDNYLDKMLERHNGCQDTITDDEIEGAYEMVTEHLFPYDADQLDEIIATMER